MVSIQKMLPITIASRKQASVNYCELSQNRDLPETVLKTIQDIKNVVRIIFPIL